VVYSQHVYAPIFLHLLTAASGTGQTTSALQRDYLLSEVQQTCSPQRPTAQSIYSVLGAGSLGHRRD
jgi:hypothetical protein